MPIPQWRITFDVENRMTQRPGFAQSPYGTNITQYIKSSDDEQTWQEPITGMMMLKPSFLTADWSNANHWYDESAITRDEPYWELMWHGNVESSDPAFNGKFLASETPTLGTKILPPISGAVHVPKYVTSSGYANDKIVIGMQTATGANTYKDEGFVINWKIASREVMTNKYRNCLYIAIEKLGVHIDFTGKCSVYWYDDPVSGVYTTATLVDSFDIGSITEMTGKWQTLSILPIPQMGVLITNHTTKSTVQKSFKSSADSKSIAGKLVQVPLRTASGNPYVVDAGKLELGFNPDFRNLTYHIAIHRVRYPVTAEGGSGYRFLTQVYDPGYVPATSPASHTIGAYQTNAATSASVSLVDSDVGTYDVGTDRFFRHKVLMSTSNAVYTPMLYGVYLRWDNLRVTRSTTPVLIDRYSHLEFFDDDLAYGGGRVRATHTTQAEIAIVERGDTTYKIERTDDPTVASPTWVVQQTGWARLGSCDVYLDNAGTNSFAYRYEADWELTSEIGRFNEVNQYLHTAFDGNSVASAVNNVLNAAGYDPIPTVDLPADAINTTVPVPPRGQSWRHGTKTGDRGDKIIRQLLMLLRKQFIEYRLRWDQVNYKWVLEQKPAHNAATIWKFVPNPADHNVATNKICVGESPKVYSITVQPPETNFINGVGTTTAQNDAARVPASHPLINRDSIFNASSPDYLGRIITSMPIFVPYLEPSDILKMSRRVYDAAAVRRFQLKVCSFYYVDGFQPGARCRMLMVNGVDTDYDDLYMKRRTVVISRDSGGVVAPKVEYSCESNYMSTVY
jgi:hypothetical protein